MGASKERATDTMTGVQNTQNTSYTNRPASRITPAGGSHRLLQTWFAPAEPTETPLLFGSFAATPAVI